MNLFSTFKNTKIKTKTLVLFAICIVFSLSVTGYFVIRIINGYFVSQIESLLISQADSFRDRMASYNNLSRQLANSNKGDIKMILNNELTSLEDTADRISGAYTIAGESGEAVQFRIMDIVDKKKIGRTGFTFAIDSDNFMTVMPDMKLQNEDSLVSKLKGKSDVTEIESMTGDRLYALCDNYEKYKWLLCAAIPEKEASAGSVYIDNFAKKAFADFVHNHKIAKTGYYYAIDMTGKIIYHKDRKQEGVSLAKEAFIKEMLKNKSGTIEYSWKGKSKIISYSYIQELNCILAGGADKSELAGSVISGIVLRFTMIATVMLVLASWLMNLLFKNTIVTPITNLGSFMEKIADGDLTDTYVVNRRDEVGTMAENVNAMASRFRATISDVNSAAVNVSQHAKDLTDSSVELSEAIRSQSERTAGVEQAVRQILKAFGTISLNIDSISAEIMQIRSSAADGKETLESTVTSIRSLTNAVQNTAENIHSLGDSSKNITEILKVITDIAEQTNLLALNAAIEAARAGEHGRGFAVVADEVRKLAERTRAATNEISGLTDDIRKQVQVSVEAISTGAEQAKDGENMITGLKKALDVIITGVIDVSESIQSVSAAMEQQNKSSREISENSATIASFSKKNSSIAENNSSQAQMLNNLSEDLNRAVAKFRLNK